MNKLYDFVKKHSVAGCLLGLLAVAGACDHDSIDSYDMSTSYIYILISPIRLIRMERRRLTVKTVSPILLRLTQKRLQTLRSM